MAERELSLLNHFEVETDGRTRHVVCLLDPVRAGALGIDSRSVIGEFSPDASGNFDLATFQVNPEFIAVFSHYMNEVAARSPEVIEAAQRERSGWLYVLDPRHRAVDDEGETPGHNLLGCFAVDDSGQIAPGSFQYNSRHEWFDRQDGVSGVLSDRRFYDWLHPTPGSQPSASSGGCAV